MGQRSRTSSSRHTSRRASSASPRSSLSCRPQMASRSTRMGHCKARLRRDSDRVGPGIACRTGALLLEGASRQGTWARRTRVDVAEVSWACEDGDVTLLVRGGGSCGDV